MFPHRTFEFITSACASLAPCPRGQLACETSRQCGHGCPYCVAKTIAIMDRHCGAFIARSPFVLIASASARGQMDISPKGDAPGFVRVLDDNSLAIPDRPGNRRADTFTNVLENPKVGLIFFVPGKSETLRISGSSKIVRDADLRESMAARGKTPDFALVLEVEEAFFHCRNALSVRTCGHHRPGRRSMGLPSLAQTMVDAAALPMPVEALQEIITQDEAASIRSMCSRRTLTFSHARETQVPSIARSLAAINVSDDTGQTALLRTPGERLSGPSFRGGETS